MQAWFKKTLTLRTQWPFKIEKLFSNQSENSGNLSWCLLYFLRTESAGLF